MSAPLPFSMKIPSAALTLDDLEADVDPDLLGWRAVQAVDQKLGAAPADILARNAQGRHRGHGVAQQVEVVEARDGDAAGTGPAAALALEQRTHRQHVAGEEAGIDVGMRPDEPRQGIGAVAEAAGRFENETRIRRQAELAQRREGAAAALL